MRRKGEKGNFGIGSGIQSQMGYVGAESKHLEGRYLRELC
jgi:hypothetical protein